jgi:hypothetical protein
LGLFKNNFSLKCVSRAKSLKLHNVASEQRLNN